MADPAPSFCTSEVGQRERAEGAPFHQRGMDFCGGRASTSSTSAPFAGRCARGGFSYFFRRGGGVFGDDSALPLSVWAELVEALSFLWIALPGRRTVSRRRSTRTGLGDWCRASPFFVMLNLVQHNRLVAHIGRFRCSTLLS